jgi:AcrR family transcriptional regulator
VTTAAADRPPAGAEALRRGGRADRTRTRLIEVAERLFAERGINAVSISEILDVAEQRNKNAVHYHFGGKEQLIKAIAEHRSAPLNRRRQQLLDQIHPQAGDDVVRDVCRALVLPLAELLEQDNYFLGFLAHYHLDRSRRQLVASVDPSVTSSYRNAGRTLRRLCELSAADFDVRYALVLDMVFTSLAGRQAYERSHDAGDPRSRARLVDNLVDCAVGAFTAPRSPDARGAII